MQREIFKVFFFIWLTYNLVFKPPADLSLWFIYPSIILRELVYDVKDILKAVCMNEPPNFIINSFSKKFIHHHVCKSYFKYEQDFPEPRRMN